jgi:hypothetical protein
MKKSSWFFLSCLLPFGVTLGAVDISPRVVPVIADHDNVFRVPGKRRPVIEAKPREPLVLRVTAHKGSEQGHDGAVHSFVIKQLRAEGWDFRLYEGTHDYPVTAPAQPGDYTVECTVKCGPGHDDMRMKLVVRP